MSGDRPTSCKRLAGHTLLEMMLSLVLLSIVMASVGSAVMFASQAVPNEKSAAGSMLADHAVLSQIAEDLASAQYVLEQTNHAVTVVVSDRTGDRIPDRLRFAWSGVRGEPLYFQLNDENATALIDAVETFDLDYTTQVVSQTLPQAIYLGAEKVLDAYTTVSSGSTVGSKFGSWFGQVINPQLHADALGFVPTKADLHAASKLPSDGTGVLSLSAYSQGQTGDAFADAPLVESDLTGSSDWNTISFRTRSVVPKGQGLALSIGCVSGSNELMLLSKQSTSGGLLGIGASVGGYLSSSNGVDWSQDTGKTFVYRVHGRELMPEPNLLATRYEHLNTIQIRLQRVADDRSPLRRGVQMLLAPPVLDSFATTGFDVDPTGMDLDADKKADWSHSAGSFPAGSINSGVWTSDGTLIFDDDALASAKVITVAARMRASDTLGPAIYGPYTVDGSGDGLPIITQLRSDGAGGQELVVYNGFSLAEDPIATLSGLRDGLIDIKLILIPDQDYLCIEIDHQPALAIRLERVADPGTIGQVVWLTSTGGVAEFGAAEIRVGGGYSTQSVGEDDSAIQLNIGGIGISLF